MNEYVIGIQTFDPDGFSTYYNAQTDSSYKEMSLPPSDLFSIDYASNQLFLGKTHV